MTIIRERNEKYERVAIKTKAGWLPERHDVQGGQEDKKVDIRDRSEELSRPELRHVLGEGVEILKYNN